ncbi:MAG: hypothetical protein P4L90_23175, partial [Rhodopila sp.]|nr:hypothetical protein [Rhodopila sp.]
MRHWRSISLARMEQESRRHGKGKPMEDDAVMLTRLLAVLDTLGGIARMMHPRRLDELVATLGDQDLSLRTAIETWPATLEPVQEQIRLAMTFTLQACTGLRSAPNGSNPTV